MSSLQKYLDDLNSSKKNEGSIGMLVRRALIDRNIFFYGQLCNNEAVSAALNSPTSAADSKTIYEVLRILTYGTWRDLQQPQNKGAADFIKSNPEISAKLRKLSLLTVAERTKSIPYDVLEKELEIASVASTPTEVSRILEDIIIDSTTAGLLTVTLSPQQRLVQVHDAAARDVNLAEVPHLLELFESWGKRCQQVVAQLQDAQKAVHQQEEDDVIRMFQMSETEYNERRKALRKLVEAGSKMRDVV